MTDPGEKLKEYLRNDVLDSMLYDKEKENFDKELEKILLSNE